MANNHASELVLEAQINYAVSLKTINKQIRQLNKDPELQKLNLKVELSQGFVNTMKKFVEATKTLSKAMENQNKVMKEVTISTRNADGALVKTTEQWLKSGEIITKVGKDYNDIVKAKKKADEASQKEIKTLEQLQAEYSSYELAKVKANYNKKGEFSSFTNTLKDKNTGNTVTVNTDGDGNLRNYNAVEDYMKQQKILQAAQKQSLDYEKQINAERERIHKETYNTNKALNEAEISAQAKQRADYKLQSQAMRENASMDTKYANTIKDNADRIAAARAQYSGKGNENLIAELNRLAQSPIGTFSQKNDTAQRLNGEIQTFQKYAQEYTKMQNTIANAQRQFNKNGKVSSGLQDLKTQLDSISGTSQQKINALAGINQQFKQLTAGAESGRKSLRLFENGMIGAIGNMARFQIALTAMYAPIQALGSMIRTVLDVDAQMTQLRRVMDEANDFGQILQNNIQIANELGRTIQEVNENSIGFARMGFSAEDVEDLTKVATLFQNISDLTPTEATDTLTAAMTVFNIEASKSINIADKLNEVDNNFAITTQDLANGISKSAASAKAAGVSIDELVGAVAAIGTTTRESGNIIGNSLKTIYARIATFPKSEEILGQAGVAYRDMEGNLRPVGDMLKDLAGNWQNLSKEQQLNTAKVLAGGYQYNRFIAYMQNFSIAQDATTTSMNSQGSAMRENEKYMDSLGARIARMKTAWQTLSLAFGDAVITDSIIALTAGLAGLLNLLTPIIKHFGALPIVLGTVATAVYFTSAAFQAWILNMARAVKSIFTVGAAATGAAGAIGATGAAAAGASVGVKALTFSLRGLMIATGVGAAFAVVGFLIEKVIGLFGQASDSVDSFADSQEKLSQASNEMDSIVNLGKTYRDLYGKVDKTAQEKAKLADVEAQLTSQFGIATTTIDGQALSYTEIQKEIQKTIDLKREELKLENQKVQSDYQKESGDAVAKAKELKETYAERRKAYEDAVKEKEKFDAQIKSGEAEKRAQSALALNPNDANSSEEIKKFVEKQAKEYSKTVNEALSEMNEADNDIQVQVGKRATAFRAIFSNQVDIFASQGAEVTDSMRQFFDAYATTAAESEMSDVDFESTIKDVFKTLNDMGPKTVTQFGQTVTVASASIDDFVNEINRLTGISMSTEQIQILNQALARTGYIASTGGIDPAVEGFEQIEAASGEAAISMENYADKFEELSNYIKPLNQAIYSMVEGQKLTSEEISNLITKYPELADAVHETSEGWTVEVDAVEKLRDARTQMFKDTIEQEKARALATVNGALKSVQAMGLEVQQVNNLKDARVELAKITEELNNIDKEDQKKKLMDSIRPDGMNELWGFGAIPQELQKQMDEIDAAKEARKQKLDELQKGAIGSVDEFENLEKTLNALLGTVEDNTYGTSAQADAQKEAEQAAKDSEKAQQGLNDSYSDTVEILTDLQQSMKKVEDQMDKESRKRERMNKNSKEYRDSLERENKLIQRQQRLLQEGMADPSKLISTTATTSYDSGGDGGTSPQTTQSAGLNSLFAKASELAADDAFNYKQVSGKFQGTFEKFVKEGVSDCSQYVQEMYEEFLGVTLPRTAAEQAKLGTTITSKKDLEPGDLVFFNTTGKADSHVGIYVGNGKFTQMGKKGLTYQSDLNSDYWSSRYTHGQRIPDVNTKAGPAGYNNITYDVNIENAYTGQYAKDINNNAEKYGINPQLIAAIIKAESNFNPNAKSGAGARGLMQLMPDTAKGLGVKDSYDPSQNIAGGTNFYSQMLQKYGDPTIALYAYNWGPGNVDKWIKAGSVFSKLPKETQAYANKVLGNFKDNGGSVTGNGVGEGGYKTTYSSATTQDLINATEQAGQKFNELGSKYFQNDLAIIDSTIGELEDDFDHIGRLLQDSERTQSNYVEGSEKWRKEEQAQINYRRQQMEIIKKENTQGAKLLDQKKIDRSLYNKQFAENLQRAKDLEQKNVESRTAIFNSQIESFNKEVEGVNRELGKSESLIGQMDSSSETYRKELQRQIKLKKQIVTINKEQMAVIKKRLETEKLTEAERESLNKIYSDLSLENFNINLDVKENIGSFTDSRIESYTKEQGRLANALSISKAKMSLLEENSKEWRAEISKQIDITKKQIDIHSLYVEELKVMLQRTDLTAEQTAKLTDALAEANVETYDLQNTLKGLYEQRFNVDSIIDDFKKMLEKQRDLELKSFDERKEAEDKRHENAMDNMQKEYDLFEKTINAQLEAIDRQSDEDTYQDELNKKLEERQKLQVLINNLSRDDSFEARARKEDLKTQLDQKDEEITKFRLDRETTLRKQNLSDQLEDRKNTLDQAQKSEDDLNKSNLENIDQEKEAREQYYDDLMDNEQYWYTLKQNLMSDDKNIVLQTINEMQGRYAEFFNYLKSNSGLLSEQGLKNAEYSYINKDSANLGDYALQVESSSGNGTNAGSGGKSAIAQDWENYLSNKQKAEKIMELMKDSARQNKTGTPTKYYNDLLAQFNQLKAANDIIRERNKTFPDYSYEVLKNMKPFSAETGGMTPANMPKEGQFLLAHQKELILNKTDTSLMLKAVNAAREYASQNVNGGFLSRLMDKVLPRLQNQQSNVAQNGNGDLIIQIENVYTEDQDSMNRFYKDIRNEMKKNGK